MLATRLAGGRLASPFTAREMYRQVWTGRTEPRVVQSALEGKTEDEDEVPGMQACPFFVVNRVNPSLPGVRLPPYRAALVLFGVAFAEMACAAFMPCCLAPRAWHQTQVGARLLLRGLLD